jgi:glutamine amidotransferase-like uncharacterized protein
MPFNSGVFTLRLFLISPQQIRRGALSGIGVLLVPGGSAKAKAEALGDAGMARIRKFVSAGGGYVGICGGAFLAAAGYGLDIVPATTIRDEFRDADGKVQNLASRGGRVILALTDEGQAVFPHAAPGMEMEFSGGPVFANWPAAERAGVVSLANYRSEIWRFEKQRNTMIGTAAIVTAKFGKGRIILFGPHPEVTPARKRMVVTAIETVAPDRAKRGKGNTTQGANSAK